MFLTMSIARSSISTSGYSTRIALSPTFFTLGYRRGGLAEVTCGPQVFGRGIELTLLALHVGEADMEIADDG